MTDAQEMTREEQVAAIMAALPRDLAYEAEFVPQRMSRNSGNKQKSINWRVTLARPGKPTLATDYMQGIGHVPGLNVGGRRTTDVAYAEAMAAEHGTYPQNGSSFIKLKLPKPDLCDVLHCLVLDAGVLQYESFEDWASEYGYDTDSREAERTYDACRVTAKQLRDLLGRDVIATLQTLFQNY